MKKILSIALCFIFGVSALAGCSQNEEPFTQETYTADAEKVQEIHIDVQDRKIDISPSDDNQIHIAYFQNSKESYSFDTSDGGVLTMTAVSNKEWTDYIGAKTSAENRKISLQIPDIHFRSLTISTTNEDISLAAPAVFKDLTLSNNGGGISFDKLKAENSITLRSKNGNISGTIADSYDTFSITCEIKKGKSNLPDEKESGTKTLYAGNNNGDIDIEFVNQ